MGTNECQKAESFRWKTGTFFSPHRCIIAFKIQFDFVPVGHAKVDHCHLLSVVLSGGWLIG